MEYMEIIFNVVIMNMSEVESRRCDRSEIVKFDTSIGFNHRCPFCLT